MRYRIWLMVILSLCPGVGYAVVRHVPAQYATIQTAIDAALDGDTVAVAAGTYPEQIDCLGKGILLLGTGGPMLTIIDGQSLPGDVVSCVSGETETTVIIGFTILRSGQGYTNFEGYQTRDAGFNLHNSSPIVRDCYVRDCNWGMSVHNSSALIEHCRVEDSFGTNCAGIYCLHGGEPMVFNCLIRNNGNGGLQATVCAATFVGNTVVDNRYAIFVSWSGDPLIMNNIVCFNSGIGISCVNGSTARISYNDVYGNSLGSYWNCSGGEGALSENPLFADGPDGDYYLSEIAAGQGWDSPCLDAGDAAATEYGLDVYTTRTDLEPDSGIVNLGYHYDPDEWRTPTPVATYTPTATATPSPTATTTPTPTATATPPPIPAVGYPGLAALLLLFGFLLARPLRRNRLPNPPSEFPDSFLA